MDRFLLDDVEDEYDAVEPLRPSSFDMSFTLSTSGDGSFPDPRNPLYRGSEDSRARRRSGTSHGLNTITDRDVAAADPRMTLQKHGSVGAMRSDSENDDEDNRSDDGSAFTRSSAAIKNRNTTLLHEQGRLHAEERHFAGYSAQVDGATSDLGRTLKAGKRKNVTSIAEKLEEKAQEAIQLSSLVSKMSWKLVKRMQDVHVYRPASVSDEDAGKVIFRVSCEVKASLHTVMEYLAQRDSKNFFDIESKVFPGLLHASVIKKMEIPSNAATAAAKREEEEGTDGEKENVSPRTQGSSVDDPLMRDFPRLQVKWHASRFAGRFVKPVDFFFVEYANIDTLPDGRKRGYGYVRSVESFKGDELATRLNSEKVTIPHSVSKCKRAMINKGVYMVTPTGSGGSSSTGGYEVTMMMFIDFQDQFSSAIGQRIIQNFTSRLVGIREQLYMTLFQPVSIVDRSEWAKASRCNLCRATFSIVKPRHHCRSCGEAVCGQCSRKWVVQPGSTHKENQTRLCTSCSLQARSFLQPDVTANTTIDMPSPADRQFGASQMRFSSRQPTPTHTNPVAAPTNPLGDVYADAGFRSTVRLPGKVPTADIHDVYQSDVNVASVITTEPNTDTAARMAFASLVNELGGSAPHLMMITYSHHHPGYAIHRALAEVAPDTLFMGGTSSGGVFTDAGSIDSGPALGLWGIYDPEGSYTVLNADLTNETPRDATRRCILAGMRLLCMEPEESPDFIWMNMSAGTEEVVIKAANEVVDCSFSIVGGGSYFVPSTAHHRATQICSEGGETGCVTTHGVCFAICSPSVEVSHAYFTCYEPKEKSFVVTKALGRDVQTLDHKPAFTALNDGCRGMLHEYVNEPERFDLEMTKLPLYYPLARQRHESRTVKLSKYQVVQPFQALPDSTLVVGSEVRVGEKLRLMSVSSETLGERLALGFHEALRTTIPVIEGANVVGCLLTVSSNYSTILQNDTHALALATARTFKNGSVLGSVSTGQQGVMLCTTETAHANAMVSALLLTNRKKALKLNPLRPVLLRRYSTY